MVLRRKTPAPPEGFGFTERGRRVLTLTREEARRVQSEFVGTEHILLGLIREDAGVASTVLSNLSIDPDQIRQRVEQSVRPQESELADPHLPYTTRAKRVVELATEQAQQFNSKLVDTEHLLLGLLAEGKGVAAQVLADLGLTLAKAQAEVRRLT